MILEGGFGEKYEVLRALRWGEEGMEERGKYGGDNFESLIKRKKKECLEEVKSTRKIEKKTFLKTALEESVKTKRFKWFKYSIFNFLPVTS